METDKISLFGFFDVFGRQSNHNWKCFFSTEPQELEITFIYNGKEYKNPKDVVLERYKLKPTTGQLTENNSVIRNTKIDFIKTNNVTGQHGNTLIDSVITNSAGKYTAYIEPGIYDINIHLKNGNLRKTNVSVQDGIKCDRNILVKGNIKSRHHDIIEISDTDYVYVFGKIVDKNKKPVKKAGLMLIKDQEIIINTATNPQGEYRFCVPYGNYIVKLFCDGYLTKTNVVTLDKTHGFAEQLTSQVQFRTDHFIVL